MSSSRADEATVLRCMVACKPCAADGLTRLTRNQHRHDAQACIVLYVLRTSMTRRCSKQCWVAAKQLRAAMQAYGLPVSDNGHFLGSALIGRWCIAPDFANPPHTLLSHSLAAIPFTPAHSTTLMHRPQPSTALELPQPMLGAGADILTWSARSACSRGLKESAMLLARSCWARAAL